MPFSKYTHVFWFVAVPDAKGGLDMGDGTVTHKDFITAGQKAGCKVSFTVGGWSDSNYFTSIMKSTTIRATLISNIKSAITTDGWDGVDLDWEYPGKAGNTNDVSVIEDPH